MRREIAITMAAFCFTVISTGCGDESNSLDHMKDSIEHAVQAEYDQHDSDMNAGGVNTQEENNTNGKVVDSPDAEDPYDQGLYRTYFYENFEPDDMVYLADVTHDGNDEMIVVAVRDRSVNGYVYTINDDGTISCIHEKAGGTDHAGGWFSWYLVNKGDYYNLGEEYFGMWQGMGTQSFMEYYVNNSGDRIDVLSVDLTSDGSSPVSDAEYENYCREVAEKFKNAYVIYNNSASSGVESKALTTDPSSVFSAYGLKEENPEIANTQNEVTESTSTQETITTSEPKPTASVTQREAWKDAYMKIVKDGPEYTIWGYNHNDCSFALFNLDNDEIPELYLSGGESFLYTFSNNRAVALEMSAINVYEFRYIPQTGLYEMNVYDGGTGSVKRLGNGSAAVVWSGYCRPKEGITDFSWEQDQCEYYSNDQLVSYEKYINDARSAFDESQSKTPPYVDYTQMINLLSN